MTWLRWWIHGLTHFHRLCVAYDGFGRVVGRGCHDCGWCASGVFDGS